MNRIEGQTLGHLEAHSGKAVSPERLKDAAQQFEASLIEELMVPLRQASPGGSGNDSGNDPDDDPDGPGSDALSGFARESMARALSAQGGFGIARSVLHYFETAGKMKPNSSSKGS